MARISLALLFVYLSISYAQPSGKSIILKMEQQMKPVDIEMDFKMTLISKNKKNKKKTHFRKMKQLEKRYQGGKFNSKLLLRFIEPKEVRGYSLLNWDWAGEKNDDQWLYIPKLRKVKRIKPSEISRNFQGTEFTYGDFVGREVNLDNYELISNDVFNGDECYLVRATPNDDSSYKARILWIDKKFYLIRKIEFYNSKDEKVKILEIPNYVKNNQYWTPTKKIMENLLNGNITEMEVLKVSYDQGLKDNLFSEKGLKRF